MQDSAQRVLEALLSSHFFYAITRLGGYVIVWMGPCLILMASGTVRCFARDALPPCIVSPSRSLPAALFAVVTYTYFMVLMPYVTETFSLVVSRCRLTNFVQAG